MSRLESDFRLLDWDSSRFGYKVARLDTEHAVVSRELQAFLRKAAEDKVKLLYVFVPPGDSLITRSIEDVGGILTDEKVTYSIKIPESLAFQGFGNLESFIGRPLTDRLRFLSFEAGKFSRYRVDPNFKGIEFEDLYGEWIRKSLTGEIAREVLVCVDGGQEVGFITLGEKDGKCNIGLIAVHPDFRGKGVGTELISAAFKNALEWNYVEMSVTTQKANIPACGLYEKMGFQVESVVNIYHVWL